MLSLADLEILTAHKYFNSQFDLKCTSLKLVIYPAQNVKMPTIVGMLTFMSRINFSISWAEHEKSFITLGPGPALNSLYS